MSFVSYLALGYVDCTKDYIPRGHDDCSHLESGVEYWLESNNLNDYVSTMIIFYWIHYNTYFNDKEVN